MTTKTNLLVTLDAQKRFSQVQMIRELSLYGIGVLLSYVLISSKSL